VDAGLVCEGTKSGDVVVEWNVDLHSLGDKILNILDLFQLIFAHDIVSVRHDHASHQTSEWGDAIPFANAQD
jgi:hypothetical protein